MSYDGNGNYSLPAGNPFVTGTTISSSTVNTTLSDIATALTNCVTRDGQSPATQNLPLGGKKITGLGAGSLGTDAANLSSVQGGAYTWCGTATGTANAITLTPSPSITAYTAGQKFVFIAANTNGGATTVAISGLSAIAVQWNQAACAGGEIVTGTIYELYLNSTTVAQVRPFNPDAYGLSNTAIFGAAGTATASRAVVLDASKNISGLGAVTAASFSGPLTGNVTGTASNNALLAGSSTQTFDVANGVSGNNAVNFSQVMGIGQLWVDETSSRSFATVYNNSSTKPITVIIVWSDSSGSTTLTAQVNTPSFICSKSANLAGASSVAVFIVPDGGSYNVTSSTGTATIISWTELR